MSDESSLPLATSGSLSPRNTDTVAYRVLKELPRPLYPVGGIFSAWPQGIVWANVSTHGLGIVTNSELAEWQAAGLIVRETPLTPPQERARMQEERETATRDAAPAQDASSATAAHPWAFPEGAVEHPGAK